MRDRKGAAKWIVAIIGLVVLFGLVGYFVGLIRTYHFAEYREHLDLTGKNVIGLAAATPEGGSSGATREDAKAFFPMLKEPSSMRRRVAFFGAYRAYNGQLGDEVHVFENVRIGDQRVARLLLQNGRVIEITIQW